MWNVFFDIGYVTARPTTKIGVQVHEMHRCTCRSSASICACATPFDDLEHHLSIYKVVSSCSRNQAYSNDEKSWGIRPYTKSSGCKKLDLQNPISLLVCDSAKFNNKSITEPKSSPFMDLQIWLAVDLAK